MPESAPPPIPCRTTPHLRRALGTIAPPQRHRVPLPRFVVFKNLIVHRLAAGWSATPADLEELLATQRFVECGATQAKSAGYEVRRSKIEGSCYEVYGVKEGKLYELFYSPEDLSLKKTIAKN